ncbi:MTD1 isoform X1 [Zea mays]|uniref:MTD1 isoform X1 n=1 Tax=Zea mays TaxID=4577 RepID=UPI0009AA31AB|nr:MTD1 isoform X1 [Zea mays]|eukprot:XP_008676415.2 MTD1 isoform X1 [Zea mays]
MPVDVEAAMAPPQAASACSSSSIGRDSDECSPPGKEEEGEGEVQSAYEGGGGGSLAGLEALEEALPIRDYSVGVILPLLSTNGAAYPNSTMVNPNHLCA